MLDRDSTARLRKRFAELRIPPSDVDRAALRQLVFEYVDELKGLGWTPERVIVAVKSIAREAGVRQTSGILRNDLPIAGPDKLLVDVVGWCIQRYYSPPIARSS
jgi:hypothetical protein